MANKHLREERHRKNIESKRWKCAWCEECFGSRGLRQKHAKEKHADIVNKKAWNKGLTKEKSEKARRAYEKLKQRYASGELTPPQLGKPHSEETKRKISESRKKYLLEHPDKIPYKLNHYSKGESYAEKYFREWMQKEEIGFIPQQQVGLYALDFLVGNIDLEIDGEQHYVDGRIKDSDIRRNEYVESQGFKVIRIRWSDYQKLSQEEKHDYLERLKVALTTDNEINDNFIIDGGKLKRIYRHCKKCGKPIYKRENVYCSSECRYANTKTETNCGNKDKKPINPYYGNGIKTLDEYELKAFYEKLIKDLESCHNNQSEVARMYGVSSSAIRKRMKRGISLGYIENFITNGPGETTKKYKRIGNSQNTSII